MKVLLMAALAFGAIAAATPANADPYIPGCFVPMGQYKNVCDPTFLYPQSSGTNGVPGTWGPDGVYTPVQ